MTTPTPITVTLYTGNHRHAVTFYPGDWHAAQAYLSDAAERGLLTWDEAKWMAVQAGKQLRRVLLADAEAMDVAVSKLLAEIDHA